MQSNTYGSATTPLQYAGQFTSAAGNPSLQYMGARWYNAQTMNSMSRDPVKATTNEPYLYVGDNPINLINPLGLCDLWDPVCDAESAGTAINQKAPRQLIDAKGHPLSGLVVLRTRRDPDRGDGDSAEPPLG